ncbi:unnamed protein product, partial [Closterium sp. NIES-53]
MAMLSSPSRSPRSAVVSTAEVSPRGRRFRAAIDIIIARTVESFFDLPPSTSLASPHKPRSRSGSPQRSPSQKYQQEKQQQQQQQSQQQQQQQQLGQRRQQDNLKSSQVQRAGDRAAQASQRGLTAGARGGDAAGAVGNGGGSGRMSPSAGALGRGSGSAEDGEADTPKFALKSPGSYSPRGRPPSLPFDVDFPVLLGSRPLQASPKRASPAPSSPTSSSISSAFTFPPASAAPATLTASLSSFPSVSASSALSAPSDSAAAPAAPAMALHQPLCFPGAQSVHPPEDVPSLAAAFAAAKSAQAAACKSPVASPLSSPSPSPCPTPSRRRLPPFPEPPMAACLFDAMDKLLSVSTGVAELAAPPPPSLASLAAVSDSPASGALGPLWASAAGGGGGKGLAGGGMGGLEGLMGGLHLLAATSGGAAASATGAGGGTGAGSGGSRGAGSGGGQARTLLGLVDPREAATAVAPSKSRRQMEALRKARQAGRGGQLGLVTGAAESSGGGHLGLVAGSSGGGGGGSGGKGGGGGGGHLGLVTSSAKGGAAGQLGLVSRSLDSRGGTSKGVAGAGRGGPRQGKAGASGHGLGLEVSGQQGRDGSRGGEAENVLDEKARAEREREERERRVVEEHGRAVAAVESMSQADRVTFDGPLVDGLSAPLQLPSFHGKALPWRRNKAPPPFAAGAHVVNAILQAEREGADAAEPAQTSEATAAAEVTAEAGTGAGAAAVARGQGGRASMNEPPVAAAKEQDLSAGGEAQLPSMSLSAAFGGLALASQGEDAGEGSFGISAGWGGSSGSGDENGGSLGGGDGGFMGAFDSLFNASAGAGGATGLHMQPLQAHQAEGVGDGLGEAGEAATRNLRSGRAVKDESREREREREREWESEREEREREERERRVVEEHGRAVAAVESMSQADRVTFDGPLVDGLSAPLQLPSFHGKALPWRRNKAPPPFAAGTHVVNAILQAEREGHMAGD